MRAFATHVLLTRAEADEIMALLRRHTRLSRELRSRLENEHQLLVVALTELAAERGASDRQHFIRNWLYRMRGEPEIERARRARKTQLASQRRRARANGHG